MLQDRAARPDGANDVLKVSDAPGEAVDASDHQDVAGMQEFQHRAQRLAALGRGAAPLLRPDDLQPAASNLCALSRPIKNRLQPSGRDWRL
jgi:hypothetical protein